MGFFDRIKRVIQRIIPGGKTGREGQGQLKQSPGTVQRPKPSGEAGVPTFREGELPSSARPQRGTKIVEREAAPSEVLAGERTTEFEKIITPEEEAGGLTQEDISAGFTLADVGGVSPITAEDILAVSGIAGAAKGLASLTFTTAKSVIKTGASKTNIAKEAARLGVSEKKLAGLVNKQALRNAVSDLARIETKKTFIGITKTQFTTAASLLIGTSGLATWLASDNLAGMASFQVSKIQGQFNNNELTREEALSQIDTQIALIEKAQKFININTMLNPGLMPFRNVFMSTVENNLEVAGNAKALVASSEETQADIFERLRQESDDRDEAFAEKQKARDEAFERKTEKAKKESDEEFRERTLLFEAIRKRNAGNDLSADELALLIKFGLDTKLVKTQNDDFGRSALNFGGLF